MSDDSNRQAGAAGDTPDSLEAEIAPAMIEAGLQLCFRRGAGEDHMGAPELRELVVNVYSATEAAKI